MFEGFERNRIKCLLCNTVIESLYGHDFKWCPCKAVAIDGGPSVYCRRRIGERNNWVTVADDGSLEHPQEIK